MLTWDHKVCHSHIETVVCLHSGCLCLNLFWMPPTWKWKQTMSLGWSHSPLLTELIEIHLALKLLLMNKNYFYAQLYAGQEACKLTHMIHLVFDIRHSWIWQFITTILRYFHEEQLLVKSSEFENNENICNKTSINI